MFQRALLKMLRTLCLVVMAMLVLLSVSEAFVIYRTYVQPTFYRTYGPPVYYHGDMDDDRYYIMGNYLLHIFLNNCLCYGERSPYIKSV